MKQITIGPSVELKKSACIDCGYELDAATGVGIENRGPKPGDITICIECGHMMAFADDLTMRALTSQEMLDAAGNEDILLIQKARGMIKR